MRRVFKNSKSITETEARIPVSEQLLVALGTLVLVFGTTYIGEIVAFVAPPDNSDTQPATINETEADSSNAAEDPFQDIEITAHSAYVWDVREQRALFNKNASEQLPLASLTKLMTALVAFELMESDSLVNISIDAIKQDGDSGFEDGDHFILRNISDFTLITSSNDGAYALAAAAGNLLNRSENPTKTFVEAMNIRAEEIGLSETYFKNPTGLDLSEHEAGAYGSARDMAFLLEYILSEHPNIIELTANNERSIIDTNGEQYVAENTNRTMNRISGLIASKTGYTDLAGGNLVIAFNAGLNRPIIISVLGSTHGGRFEDVVRLSDAAHAYVNN